METLRTVSYTVNLQPIEDGGFFVTVPALPGCVTQGETLEEALMMATDVIQAWVESLVKGGEPVPVEQPESGVAVSYRVNVPMSA
ncbi:MAG: type II toxin-antitoxin system HicB family antitoxin [Candidatus Hydrogenedentes bacterium]|nr:type II toxin-antitoxin system HicB family antitoxin [Candidatus Hydrogenedentota bacterium]